MLKHKQVLAVEEKVIPFRTVNGISGLSSDGSLILTNDFENIKEVRESLEVIAGNLLRKEIESDSTRFSLSIPVEAFIKLSDRYPKSFVHWIDKVGGDETISAFDLPRALELKSISYTLTDVNLEFN